MSSELIEGVRAIARRQNPGAEVFEKEASRVPHEVVIVNGEDGQTPRQRE